MRPEVTVLLPVRDGARWLRQAAESILSQSYEQLELLVVDDGSSDDTPAILAHYAGADRRVRIVTQPRSGLVSALNAGLRAARSDLIARMDADDVAVRHRLEEQVRYLRAHPSAVLVGSWACKIDENGEAIGHLRPRTGDAELRAALRRGNPFIHPSVMFRAAAVRELGGYRAALFPAEDYDLWLRLSEVGMLANLPEDLIFYRVHAGSTSSRDEMARLFATRIARRGALLRSEDGPDDASIPREPPHWMSPEAAATFYAEDAALFREMACPGIAARRGLLTRGERKAAQNLLFVRADAAEGLAQRLRFWRAILLLYPRRAPALFRRWLRACLRRRAASPRHQP